MTTTSICGHKEAWLTLSARCPFRCIARGASAIIICTPRRRGRVRGRVGYQRSQADAGSGYTLITIRTICRTRLTVWPEESIGTAFTEGTVESWGTSA